MQIEYTKGRLAALWMLLIGVFGYATGTASVAGLAILFVFALTPPLVMWQFRRKPGPTMSESIHNALE